MWILIALHSSHRLIAVYRQTSSTYFHRPRLNERVPWLTWCPFTKEGGQWPWQKSPTVLCHSWPPWHWGLAIPSAPFCWHELTGWRMLAEALWSHGALCASPRVQRPSSGTVFFFSLHSTLKTTKRNSLHKWKEPEMRGQKPEEPLGKVL